MKKLFLTLTAISGLISSQPLGDTTETYYVQLVRETNQYAVADDFFDASRKIELADGDSLLVSVDSLPKASQPLETFFGVKAVRVRGSLVDRRTFQKWNTQRSFWESSYAVVGPATVYVDWVTSVDGVSAFPNSYFAHTSAGTVLGKVTITISHASVPVDRTVIVTRGTKNTSLVLEVSSDLKNWAPASPGEITEKHIDRFYRLRTVKVNNP